MKDILQPPASCVVYTPQPLAEAMVDSIRTESVTTWLEPSCGRGVFVGALLKSGIDGSMITAVDLALDVGSLERDGVKVLPGIDFLEWSTQCQQQFDCIVGNPPYVRISELPDTMRQHAAAVQQMDSRPVGLKANTWYAFFCAAFRLLGQGGCMALVLPASWEFADYAAPVRDQISGWFRSVRIYRCRRSFFGDVRDGVVVLIARGRGQRSLELKRSVHDSIESVIAALRAEETEAEESREVHALPRTSKGAVRLGDVMTVQIGAVTGDSRYFLLKESERLRWGLPEEACSCVLTKSRHLISAFMNASTWHTLKESDQRVWLFRPPECLITDPAVSNYLDLPETAGGCRKDAFKVKEREPWHRTKLPREADAFLSGNTRVGPWLALRRMQGLTATNTLYVARFHEDLGAEQQAAWGLAMLTSAFHENWRTCVRVYPDGLVKMEPGDIAGLQLPRPPLREDSETIYRQAIALLLEGKQIEARDLADRWMSICL
jgi:adenine-specific DNA-methyltransferase